MKLLQEGNPLIRTAVRAGMSKPTARKYARSGQMPSELKGTRRTWRTRPDPYAEFWPEIAGWLKLDGLNFCKRTEQQLLRALQHPEFNIHGVRRADLIALLPDFSPAALSRQLRRLRSLGVIKRVTGTYRFYLTLLGRTAIAAARSIMELRIVPTLAASR